VVPEEHSTSADLARAVEELQRALARARGQDIDATLLGAVDTSLTEARNTVRELARPAGTGTRIGKASVRSQVIEALTDLGVPTSAALIAAYHRAVFDSELHPRGLTSLRRDEARTLDSSSSAPVLVVPTLTPQLAPARGLFALSTWPGWLRITGVYSERVNHLHAVRRMLDYLQNLPAADEQHRAAITSVLLNFGQSIDGLSFAGIDVAAARATVDHQLALIEGKDRADRESAAELLAKEPDITAQLFGKKRTLRVVGGDK
jgi:hypothetical protein